MMNYTLSDVKTAVNTIFEKTGSKSGTQTDFSAVPFEILHNFTIVASNFADNNEKFYFAEKCAYLSEEKFDAASMAGFWIIDKDDEAFMMKVSKLALAIKEYLRIKIGNDNVKNHLKDSQNEKETDRLFIISQKYRWLSTPYNKMGALCTEASVNNLKNIERLTPYKNFIETNQINWLKTAYDAALEKAFEGDARPRFEFDTESTTLASNCIITEGELFRVVHEHKQKTKIISPYDSKSGLVEFENIDTAEDAGYALLRIGRIIDDKGTIERADAMNEAEYEAFSNPPKEIKLETHTTMPSIYVIKHGTGCGIKHILSMKAEAVLYSLQIEERTGYPDVSITKSAYRIGYGITKMFMKKAKQFPLSKAHNAAHDFELLLSAFVKEGTAEIYTAMRKPANNFEPLDPEIYWQGNGVIPPEEVIEITAHSEEQDKELGLNEYPINELAHIKEIRRRKPVILVEYCRDKAKFIYAKLTCIPAKSFYGENGEFIEPVYTTVPVYSESGNILTDKDGNIITQPQLIPYMFKNNHIKNLRTDSSSDKLHHTKGEIIFKHEIMDTFNIYHQGLKDCATELYPPMKEKFKQLDGVNKIPFDYDKQRLPAWIMQGEVYNSFMNDLSEPPYELQDPFYNDEGKNDHELDYCLCDPHMVGILDKNITQNRWRRYTAGAQMYMQMAFDWINTVIENNGVDLGKGFQSLSGELAINIARDIKIRKPETLLPSVMRLPFAMNESTVELPYEKDKKTGLPRHLKHWENLSYASSGGLIYNQIYRNNGEYISALFAIFFDLTSAYPWGECALYRPTELYKHYTKPTFTEFVNMQKNWKECEQTTGNPIRYIIAYKLKGRLQETSCALLSNKLTQTFADNGKTATRLRDYNNETFISPDCEFEYTINNLILGTEKEGGYPYDIEILEIYAYYSVKAPLKHFFTETFKRKDEADKKGHDAEKAALKIQLNSPTGKEAENPHLFDYFINVDNKGNVNKIAGIQKPKNKIGISGGHQAALAMLTGDVRVRIANWINRVNEIARNKEIHFEYAYQGGVYDVQLVRAVYTDTDCIAIEISFLPCNDEAYAIADRLGEMIFGDEYCHYYNEKGNKNKDKVLGTFALDKIIFDFQMIRAKSYQGMKLKESRYKNNNDKTAFGNKCLETMLVFAGFNAPESQRAKGIIDLANLKVRDGQLVVPKGLNVNREKGGAFGVKQEYASLSNKIDMPSYDEETRHNKWCEYWQEYKKRENND